MSDAEVVIATLDVLTRREAEAVLWIAQGKTSWEAGRILGVSEHTLNTHVVHAAEKLEASNRAHLVARAFVRGILAAGKDQIICVVLAFTCLVGQLDDARVSRRGNRTRRREDAAMVIEAGAGS